MCPKTKEPASIRKEKAIEAIKECIESGRKGMKDEEGFEIYSECLNNKKGIDYDIVVKVERKMVSDPSYAKEVLGSSYKSDYASIIRIWEW